MVPVDRDRNQIVARVDVTMDRVLLALNQIGDVPVSGLVTGVPRVFIGGSQLVTAAAVSALRLANRPNVENRSNVENQRVIDYIVQDGVERASRGAVNIFLGVVETLQAAALLVNPFALIYRVAEYANANRPNPR